MVDVVKDDPTTIAYQILCLERFAAVANNVNVPINYPFLLRVRYDFLLLSRHPRISLSVRLILFASSLRRLCSETTFVWSHGATEADMS